MASGIQRPSKRLINKKPAENLRPRRIVRYNLASQTARKKRTIKKTPRRPSYLQGAQGTQVQCRGWRTLWDKYIETNPKKITRRMLGEEKRQQKILKKGEKKKEDWHPEGGKMEISGLIG